MAPSPRYHDSATGDDTILANGGNDELDGGDGSDWLNGGDGTDICKSGETANDDCEQIEA